MENIVTTKGQENSAVMNEVYLQNYPDKLKDPLTILLDRSNANRLDAAIAEFIKLNESLSSNESYNYLRASAVIHGLLDAIFLAEKSQTKEEIRNKLGKVREIHRQSPFFVRTQDWPRGYAGDFETIEYIIEGLNKSPENSLGYYLEGVILNSPIVQQHRNKITHQARLILEKVYEKDDAKILSIGCGSSADLRTIQNSLSRTNVQITLFDMDEGALACSSEKLASLGDKCHFIQGNLLRLVKKIEEKFDLIVIGGVFDYLTDKTISSILNKISLENLNENGEIFFTNIAKGNPYRTWMEYCFDWELIERTKEDIQLAFEQANISGKAISIKKEETGLTYVAHIK